MYKQSQSVQRRGGGGGSGRVLAKSNEKKKICNRSEVEVCLRISRIYEDLERQRGEEDKQRGR